MKQISEANKYAIMYNFVDKIKKCLDRKAILSDNCEGCHPGSIRPKDILFRLSEIVNAALYYENITFMESEYARKNMEVKFRYYEPPLHYKKKDLYISLPLGNLGEITITYDIYE